MAKPDMIERALMSDRRSTAVIELGERLAQTPIVTPINYERDGKQDGFLRLFNSTEKNGYGYIPIPVVCIRNGPGPTAILVGGNHGNEYEGIVGLMHLARQLEASQVRGRIIILPALNYPAVMSATRSSPLDGANLNRCFPGTALGGPTAIIAHYVSSVLLPLADVVVDLHAGGRSGHFVPCAIVQEGRSPEEVADLADLADAFGAPMSFVSKGKGRGGSLTLAGECLRQGVACLTAELGGGETVSRQGLDLAIEGVKRILAQLDILSQQDTMPASGTRWVTKDLDSRIHAHAAGIFEPCVGLGDSVHAGQVAGLIHFPDMPMAPPDEIRAPFQGRVLSLHIPALVARGDELFTLVSDVDPRDDACL